MKRKTINIRKDQEEFLKNNPHINLSGLARNAIEEHKKKLGDEI
jgi:hypothetical protein